MKRALHGAGPRLYPLRPVIAAVIVVIALATAGFAILLFTTPPASQAEDIVSAQAQAHGSMYRGLAPPQRFVDALVATEDHRFGSPLNVGIDPLAIARAMWGWITVHRDGGGSTIAQQLAKMLYTPGQSGWLADLEQVVLAVKLNFAYPKPKILSMYAAMAYYGDGYYGLDAASCGYFGRPPSELTWSQAALLAGVLNAPTADDPRTHPDAAHAREAHVLARLVAVGELTAEQADTALSQPLGLVRDRSAAGC
jgi:membrane peptidoglycan carboxypeptidase